MIQVIVLDSEERGECTSGTYAVTDRDRWRCSVEYWKLHAMEATNACHGCCEKEIYFLANSENLPNRTNHQNILPYNFAKF